MCASYNIECKCQHILGIYNIESDLLSRSRLADYLNYNPNADRVMTTPLNIWYDGIVI